MCTNFIKLSKLKISENFWKFLKTFENFLYMYVKDVVSDIKIYLLSDKKQTTEDNYDHEKTLKKLKK